MSLSPEQFAKLQKIVSKVQEEKDHATFSLLMAELIALYEEAERFKHESAA